MMKKKNKKELENVEGMATDVRTKEQAVSFLTLKDYLIHGNPVDLSRYLTYFYSL